MILFSFPDYEYLAEPLSKKTGLERGHFLATQFSYGEIGITLKSDVIGQECVVLGGSASKEQELEKLLLLAHTLKENGTQKVIILTPYLHYVRQDRKEENKSFAAKWLGELFKGSGANEVVTVDVHSPEVPKLFPVPLISLSAMKLFARELSSYKTKELTLVAPDKGALNTCKEFNKELDIRNEVAFFEKKRIEKEVSVSELHGSVDKEVILVDDILDTGGTMIQAAQYLVKEGVEKITIVVTHGLFSGSKWEELWDLGVDKIYCTDTVPRAWELASNKIKVLSIAPILISYIGNKFKD